MKIINRKFVCYLHFVGWNEISLGFHIDVLSPNLEIHLPFCFIKIGWSGTWIYKEDTNRTFGIK